MSKFTVEVLYSPVLVTVEAMDEDSAWDIVSEMLNDGMVNEDEQVISIGNIYDDIEMPEEVGFDDDDLNKFSDNIDE